jgi:hypothetical protein
MKKNELTIKEALFVDEYLKNGYIASRAYQVAYQTTNKGMAKVESYRLLQKQKIKDKIEESEMSFRHLARENGLDRRSILFELKKIIKGNNPKATLAAINTLCHLKGEFSPDRQIIEVEQINSDYSKLNEDELRIKIMAELQK